MSVSVILPVYNCEKYLSQAIDSILEQSYTDFELIILDDGSTDSSTTIIADRSRADSRIRVHRFDKNVGIVSALNQGLDLARGKYIARMDADDISLPQRLAQQVQHLDTHHEIGILGTNFRYIDQNGSLMESVKYPQTHMSIRWYSYLFNPFAHPTTMFRADILKEHSFSYRPEMSLVEDYDLWARMLKLTRGANLPDTLLYYRIHPSQLTNSFPATTHQKHRSLSQSIIEDDLPEMRACLPDVTGLIRAIIGDKEPDIFLRRAEYAHQYILLWKAFEKKYGPQSREAVSISVPTIIDLCTYPRRQSNGWIPLLQLFSIDKFWWARFGITLIKKLTRKLRSRPGE